MNEEQMQKMRREVEEETRMLKSYFEDDLDEYDIEEIKTSLGKMFQIGFNYSQNLNKTNEDKDENWKRDKKTCRWRKK